MKRFNAIPYVSYVVDDSLSGRKLGEDHNAIIRDGQLGYKHRSVLVGWQCGFEPLFVAVHSYLDIGLDDEEAEEIASDYLKEIGWFAGVVKDADYILR